MSTIRAAGLGTLTASNTATIVDPQTPTNGIARVGTLVSYSAVASTSGTNVAFSNVPSWVRRITIMIQGVSTTGSLLGVQLGTSGGFTTSGYLGASNDGGTPSNYSTAFWATPGFGAGGAFVVHGMFVITNITGNSWTETHTICRSDTTGTGWGAGSIALSGTLTQIRLIGDSSLTSTFDAGTINVMYE
jgi:hypothetical protein